MKYCWLIYQAILSDACRQQGHYSICSVLPAAPERKHIAVSPKESGITAVPVQELNHIWSKAVDLLSSDASIVACPGHETAFAVASAHDPTKPHIVTPLASGEIRCSTCPQNTRLSICSHAVAVAERKSILHKFLAWYMKNREKPNFSRAANQGMPGGRGKKGERAPRKQKPKHGQRALPTHFVDRLQVSCYSSQAVNVNTNSGPVNPDNQTATATQPAAHSAIAMQPVSGIPALSATQQLAAGPPAHDSAIAFQPVFAVPATQHTTPRQPFQGYRSPFSAPYHNTNLFVLQFHHGNIRRCTGCGGGIDKKSGLAQNLVLQHMERYQYPTGNPFQPIKYTLNKERAHYYHARKACVLSRHPYFNTSMIDLTLVQNALTEQHKLQLVLELDLFLP